MANINPPILTIILKVNRLNTDTKAVISDWKKKYDPDVCMFACLFVFPKRHTLDSEFETK